MAPVGVLGQFQAQVGEGLVRGALLAAAYALYRTLYLAVEQIGNVALHALQVVDPCLLGRRQVLQAAVLLEIETVLLQSFQDICKNDSPEWEPSGCPSAASPLEW